MRGSAERFDARRGVSEAEERGRRAGVRRHRRSRRTRSVRGVWNDSRAARRTPSAQGNAGCVVVVHAVARLRFDVEDEGCDRSVGDGRRRREGWDRRREQKHETQDVEPTLLHTGSPWHVKEGSRRVESARVRVRVGDLPLASENRVDPANARAVWTFSAIEETRMAIACARSAESSSALHATGIANTATSRRSTARPANTTRFESAVATTQATTL